ncbi:MAG: DUF5309 domain-containing protein [Deltaproteobacteria bacterium]|nr:DUF5309 domain-containing protein [Deltaproteobacteria bacterium]MCB2188377.1 DUF5309 domain-containing protein [Deltaproteobacteria bacterium]
MSIEGTATVWNCLNYVGELYKVYADHTPFLSMIGGLSGGGRTVGAWEFALSQYWAPDTAAQPAISETAAAGGAAATTYTRAQEYNVCQIFQRGVEVTYPKLSNWGGLSGLSVQGEAQPVANELDFQVMANLEQIALDVEYTFLNGAYQNTASAATAFQTRGIIEACTTNAVDASGAALSKTLVDQLLRTMATSGSRFRSAVVFVNAFQKQKFSDIYGYAPADRNVGGVNIKQVETDFAMLGVIWTPQMPAGSLLVADVAYCAPVFLPVPGKGLLFYEPLSKTGASEKGQVYGQVGLDYANQKFHGVITNLATS